MNVSKILRASLLAAAPCAALSASAGTLFYGGDEDGSGVVLRSQVNSSASYVYDDFTLTAPASPTGVFGNFAFFNDGTPSEVTALHYEIRQGISAGNGGTLLYSGNVTPTFTLLPTLIRGTQPYYNVSGSLSGVALGAGTYFLDVALVDPRTFATYLVQTSGANGVGGPLNDGNSYYVDATRNFATTASQGYGHDFSIGLTTPVPEPSAFAALGLGAVVLLQRRKR